MSFLLIFGKELDSHRARKVTKKLDSDKVRKVIKPDF